jgi:tryptophan synthase alpha chain
MSRLHDTFSQLRARNERAFVPFVTCGDPDLAKTRELALAYTTAGADILEIGIPFTDPLADGPTIQRASERALAAGTNMEMAFELIASLRTVTQVPLVPMTYINPVWQIGYDRFAAQCKEAGVDAVIISDLPPEEGGEWIDASARHGISTVFLLAPTSDEARMKTVAAATTGFIYAVARMGVTGARQDVPPEIKELVDQVRALTPIPVCAGFGFSSPSQIRQTCATTQVDGIVVASALIDCFEKSDFAIAPAAAYAAQLKAATRPS